MTGGSSYSYSSGSYTDYSSTEQLVKGGTEWILTENSLPARMRELRGISFNNQIFATGKTIILNKVLFIYQTNYSFNLQEVTIRMQDTWTKYCYWMKRQQLSRRLANWNKEELVIQWVLLTLMISFVPNFEHVKDYFKHVNFLLELFLI